MSMPSRTRNCSAAFFRFLDVIEDRESLAHLDSLGTGYPAWLWFLESRNMAQPAWHQDSYTGCGE